MSKKIFLNESEMPSHWYNIVADMPNKPLPHYTQEPNNQQGPKI
jgi:tryptophan synthase beta chain